jgi:hypothetical protein
MTNPTWTIALFAAMTAGMNVTADRCRANEPTKPIRIVWTGASFVPGEIIELTTKMINQDNDDLKAESEKMSRGGTSLGSAIQRLNLLEVIAKGKCWTGVIDRVIVDARATQSPYLWWAFPPRFSPIAHCPRSTCDQPVSSLEMKATQADSL